jgi:hypothetical protein
MHRGWFGDCEGRFVAVDAGGARDVMAPDVDVVRRLALS